MIKKKQLEEDCKLRFEMREKAEKRILEATASEEEEHRAKQQRNLQRAADFDSIKYLTDKQKRAGKTHYSDNEIQQRNSVAKYSSEPLYAGSTSKSASVTQRTQKKQRTLLEFLNTDSGTTETETATLSESTTNSLPSYHSSQQELPIFAPARRTIALAHPQASDSSDTDRSRSTRGRQRTDDSSTEDEQRERLSRSRRDQDKIYQQLSQ